LTFPVLTTKRLSMDRITLSDVVSIFELFANPDVVRYYDLEVFTELEQAERLIRLYESRHASSSGIRWGIRLSDTGKLIGTCGFNAWNEKMKNATLGYDLMSAYWNRGLATEAVTGIVRAAFSGLLSCGPLHRIQADTLPGNVASEKVLMKLGFQEEGIRRHAAFLRGSYYDMKCFGLLEEEFIDS